jgi:hypothetical protein
MKIRRIFVKDSDLNFLIYNNRIGRIACGGRIIKNLNLIKIFLYPATEGDPAYPVISVL